MGMKHKKSRLALVLALVGVTMGDASAHEAKPLKLKSMKVARVLAFDPIPGDALFYAGKPLEGTLNAVAGAASGALLGYGIYLAAKPCHDEGPDLGPCLGQGLGALYAIVVGGPLFVTTLIWDGAAGVRGVAEHNERVKKQSMTFAPEFNLDSKGNGYAGIRIGF